MSQYRIDIFGLDHTDTPHTALFAPDISVQRWSKRINAPGTMVFSMKATNPRADDGTLRPYRRVKLYRRNRDGTPGYSPVWLGYILATQQVEDRIEVICTGMLNLFKKRWADTNETFNGQGSTEAFGLLSDANGDSDTFIVSGTGDVTTTKNLQAQGDISVFRAWELIAQAHEAEFEIDDTGTFNFVSSLGSDKSGTVTLTYNRSRRPGTNVVDLEYGESGEDMATHLICSTSAGGGLTSTRPTSPSSAQTTYGYIVERRQFNEAQDQATLNSLTERLLAQIENPLTSFNLAPQQATKRLNIRTGEREVTGLQYGDVVPGDLITVVLNTENRSMSTAKRVAELAVEVDSFGQEKMLFTLSEAGVFITAGYLEANRVSELVQRVKEIQSVLS